VFLYCLYFSIANAKINAQSLTLQKIRFDFDHVRGPDKDRLKIMKFIEDLAAEDCLVPKINCHLFGIIFRSYDTASSHLKSVRIVVENFVLHLIDLNFTTS
jgi:hypothetical protein